jgi:Cdc6-like AAA superfamily ATPase
MANRGPGSAQRSTLLGRHGECALFDGLVAAIRQGESRSFVLRGKAGRGKTAPALRFSVESQGYRLRSRRPLRSCLR